MRVHRSGYYQWLNQPISNRELENEKLLTHIKEAYNESNGVYDSRNIHKDLRELGIYVNKKRVARLMSEAKLYGVGTYMGKNCDTYSKKYGKGTWSWANGGFEVLFKAKRFAFGRQEVFMEHIPDLNMSKCSM